MPLLLYTYVSLCTCQVVVHRIRCSATWSWIASFLWVSIDKNVQQLLHTLPPAPEKTNSHSLICSFLETPIHPRTPLCQSMKSYPDLHSAAAAGFFYSDRCYRLPCPVSDKHQGRPIVSSA